MIIIDLREEHEMKKSHLDPSTCNVINIPMRSIPFNLNYIENLSKNDEIQLMCKSGNRSDLIKKKYFEANDKVSSMIGGIKKVGENSKIKVIELNGAGMGIQQYMQVMFVCILVVSSIILYFGGWKYAMVFNVLMVVMIFLQLYTKSCVLGKMLGVLGL